MSALPRPTADVAAVVSDAAAAHRGSGGALLPILHEVQARLGHIPASSIQPIADELNLSRAEVYGVITFYKDFREEPPGRLTVSVCRAEACQAVGAEQLLDHASDRLRVDVGETTEAITLDQVFCLGNCALGPSVTIAGRLYGRVTPERFDLIMNAVAP